MLCNFMKRPSCRVKLEKQITKPLQIHIIHTHTLRIIYNSQYLLLRVDRSGLWLRFQPPPPPSPIRLNRHNSIFHHLETARNKQKKIKRIKRQIQTTDPTSKRKEEKGEHFLNEKEEESKFWVGWEVVLNNNYALMWATFLGRSMV